MNGRKRARSPCHFQFLVILQGSYRLRGAMCPDGPSPVMDWAADLQVLEEVEHLSQCHQDGSRGRGRRASGPDGSPRQVPGLAAVLRLCVCVFALHTCVDVCAHVHSGRAGRSLLLVSRWSDSARPRSLRLRPGGSRQHTGCEAFIVSVKNCGLNSGPCSFVTRQLYSWSCSACGPRGQGWPGRSWCVFISVTVTASSLWAPSRPGSPARDHQVRVPGTKSSEGGFACAGSTVWKGWGSPELDLPGDSRPAFQQCHGLFSSGPRARPWLDRQPQRHLGVPGESPHLS